MLTARVGKMKMARRLPYKFILQVVSVLVTLVLLISFILQRNNQQLKVDWSHAIAEEFFKFSPQKVTPKRSAPLCSVVSCPDNHHSFYIQSGAANAVGPKICLNNNIVLGIVKNNAGSGINIVVMSDKTHEVTQMGNFNMYSGDVKPLIEFLKKIETGSVVLMASFDEPASKLNEEARKLITELGSSYIASVGFRDNWVFVGKKGATEKSKFEKYMKNVKEKNTYEEWPELISIEGCLPKSTI